MLVNGVGITKSSASNILFMGRYYYNSSGSIKSEWKGFGTKSLIYLAHCHNKEIMDIFALRKSNSINPTMKYEEIKNFASQFVDEEDSTIWGLFGF